MLIRFIDQSAFEKQKITENIETRDASIAVRKSDCLHTLKKPITLLYEAWVLNTREKEEWNRGRRERHLILEGNQVCYYNVVSR